MKEEVKQILNKLSSTYNKGWDTFNLQSLFKEDSSRFDKFHVHVADELDLLFDYSKNHITKETLDLLLSLADAAELPRAIDNMFKGERINFTEDRAVLHVALRHPEGMGFKEVVEVRERMGVFVEKVRSGEWKGFTGKRITDIVNIGIGGSDLGPYMVCEALAPFSHNGMNRPIKAHFVSNIDGTHLAEVLRPLDRETVLFIIASKTFTTLETITNANSAKEWFLKGGDITELSDNGALPESSDVAKHFIAVSTNKEKVSEFGISLDNMFEFWDWVGGRYSLWSSIGISIALYIGYQNFLLLLRGAYLMDEHFKNTEKEKNIPLLMAVIGILNNNILKSHTYCVVPYDQYLHRFSAYLQQLDMESNGKHVTRDGKKVEWETGPIVWGEPGTNSQHAYFQLLHQGTNVIPIDFLAPVKTQNPLRADHHSMLVANVFAQAEALMNGQSKEEIIAEMKKANQPDDVIERIANHRVAEGNRPSNTFLFHQLDPLTLGALIAMYEHKVFVQGVIWGINSFDQWGVELGKQLAKKIMPELKSSQPVQSHDSSTNALINFYNKKHQSSL